jgi:peroxiredoxin (alkyl hydroperoxide reductase subunit C)
MLDHQTDAVRKKLGERVPDVFVQALLPNGETQTLALKDFEGNWLVLLFFISSFGPVSTKDVLAFNDEHHHFETLNAKVLGVATDQVFWFKYG